MEELKEIWAGLLLIVCLMWVEAHLIMIAMWDVVRIIEANPWILYTEIALTGGMIIFAIERLVKDVKK